MTTQNDKKYQFRGGGGGQIIIWKAGKVGGGGVFAISLFLGIQRFLSCSLYYY